MVDAQSSLSSIMSGCPVATGDTIYFTCTPFNMFADAGSDALAETFFDSVIYTKNDESVLISSYP